MSDLLGPVELAWHMSAVAPESEGALRRHIAELEKERDAALADNAALLMFVAPLAEVACEGVGPEACGECVSCMAKLHVTQPHPGAALLEEHRKALVRARNEGLEAAAEAIETHAKRPDDFDLAHGIRAMKEPE